MDIVCASLDRRLPAEPASEGETAEVLAALWAHARPDDSLEHITARPEPDRIDLLLYFLTRPTDASSTRSPLHRAGDLLHRSHQASPLLRRRYLPPQLLAA
ncbi:hypothetical protein [Kitasatospora sp. NPDC001683]